MAYPYAIIYIHIITEKCGHLREHFKVILYSTAMHTHFVCIFQFQMSFGV